MLRTEEIKARIAERVREGSKNIAKKLISAFLPCEPKSVREKVTPLTTANTFNTSVVDVLGSDKVEVNLAEMLEDDRYQDIKSLVTVTGAAYLYSERYITKNYAQILLGVAANDPSDTITEMVREDSRFYRRPTNTELFKEPVFNIDPDGLETHIAHILEQAKFKDIKQMHASTEACYLYSNRYIDEARASKLVKRIEVSLHSEKNAPKT